MDKLDYIVTKYKLDTGSPSPILIPGLKRQELTKLFGELKLKTGAEIGVERGLFSEEICKAVPGVKLYCIDAWEKYEEYPEHNLLSKIDRLYNETKTRLAPYNCTIIKKYSMDAVRDFASESLDFVYIDGNHDFDFVMSDIIFWSKIVKHGGIVSGHDYTIRNVSHTIYYGVIPATNVYTKAHNIKPWFVFNGERSASWFWVKP